MTTRTDLHVVIVGASLVGLSSALALDHTVNLAPWELKTLLVTPEKNGRSQVKEVSLLEV